MTTLDQGRTDNARGFHRWLFVASLFFATFCDSEQLKAAPITFAFDADVTRVFPPPSPDFTLPFSVHVGDTIRGRFTFEPSPIGHLGAQDLGLQFEIGGTTLESPTYEVRAVLNEVTRQFNFIDELTVRCSFLSSEAQCVPGTVPMNPEVNWRPFLSLTETSPILASYYLPGDVAIWNSFTGRSLSLSFWSTSGGTVIDAIVGPMQVVPEPSSLQLAGGLAIIFMLINLHASTRRWWRASCPSADS